MAKQHGHKTALVGRGALDMEQVHQALVEWRREHKPPTPIPAELWARAAELAQRHGVGHTARTLRLDQGALKHRMINGVAPQASATFVELLAPVSGYIAECALEVESSRGARMRVAMKNVAPSGLASIIRDFVG